MNPYHHATPGADYVPLSQAYAFCRPPRTAAQRQADWRTGRWLLVLSLLLLTAVGCAVEHQPHRNPPPRLVGVEREAGEPLAGYSFTK